MNELKRAVPRTNFVDQIRAEVEDKGFRVVLAGGIYYLQGVLSDRVAASVRKGVGLLIAAFALVALAVSRSIRIAGAMVAPLMLVPIGIFGSFGLLGVPLDILAAPAANVAMGLAAGVTLVLLPRLAALLFRHPIDDAV